MPVRLHVQNAADAFEEAAAERWASFTGQQANVSSSLDALFRAQQSLRKVGFVPALRSVSVDIRAARKHICM